MPYKYIVILDSDKMCPDIAQTTFECCEISMQGCRYLRWCRACLSLTNTMVISLTNSYGTLNCVPVQGSIVFAGILLLSHPGFQQRCRMLRAAHPAASRGGGVQSVLCPVPVQSRCLPRGHQSLICTGQLQQSCQGTVRCTPCTHCS